MQLFPVLYIDFFLCPPSACTLSATFSLLTPPQTLPAVLVQTPRKKNQKTQNRNENIEEHLWDYVLMCTFWRALCAFFFFLIYASNLVILFEKKERMWRDEGERVGERGRRGEIEELQIVTGKLVRLTWIMHPYTWVVMHIIQRI